jgi:hypothetical protein
MHQFLTQRAEHLRPPATITATASGAVTRARADYTTVAEDVPAGIYTRSASLRQAEYGEETPADFTGFVDAQADIRVRDLLVIDSDVYEVRSIGNRGTFLVAFDAARVVVR